MLIKEEFPLHPIFNKNTLKVSYCSMRSVKDIINSHNHKLLANKEQHSAQDQLTKLCNCRSKTDCPLQGKCLLSAIIYQAKVSTQVGEESYIGLTETSFTTTTKPHLHIKKINRTKQTHLATKGFQHKFQHELEIIRTIYPIQ